MKVQDLDVARQFVQENNRAILVTRRRDDRLQASPIRGLLDDEGRIIISTRAVTAKARNLRRDPRATLCFIVDKWAGPWLNVEGTAEVIGLPEAMPLLEDFYRRREGADHPNWDEYRQLMETEGRVLVRIRIDAAITPR
jgi:PPOX class probable F420-dependent enzyme